MNNFSEKSADRRFDYLYLPVHASVQTSFSRIKIVLDEELLK